LELRLADYDCEEFLIVGLHDAVEEFSEVFELTSERQTPKLSITKQRLGVSKEFVNCYRLGYSLYVTVLNISHSAVDKLSLSSVNTFKEFSFESIYQ
jgi:hypothetical protein